MLPLGCCGLEKDSVKVLIGSLLRHGCSTIHERVGCKTFLQVFPSPGLHSVSLRIAFSALDSLNFQEVSIFLSLPVGICLRDDHDVLSSIWVASKLS